jgi:hypothetical protein
MNKDGVAMVRRIHVLFASIGLILLTLVGCESLRQAIRSSSSETSESHKTTKSSTEATAVESDPSKIQAVDSDAQHPRSFFSNNRRSGGWSSEAREVESHLGVGP